MTQRAHPNEPDSRERTSRTPTQPVAVLLRAGRTVAGGLLLLVGAALLVLPGPGLLVIAAGLAVLATDYQWARHLTVRARGRLAAARRRITGPRSQPPPR
jgi:hypothetical protein